MQIIQLRKMSYSAKGRRKPPEKHTAPTKTLALFKDGQLQLIKLNPVKQTLHTAQVFAENTARYFAVSPHKTLTSGIKHSPCAVNIKNQHIKQPLIAEAKQQVAQLHAWMERFKGVASKYLQNYWNWYATLINLSQLKHEKDQFCRLCTNSRSLNQYYITKML